MAVFSHNVKKSDTRCSFKQDSKLVQKVVVPKIYLGHYMFIFIGPNEI